VQRCRRACSGHRLRHEAPCCPAVGYVRGGWQRLHAVVAEIGEKKMWWLGAASARRVVQWRV